MSLIDPLLAVQNVDMEIWRLQNELKDLPARKRAEENNLQDAVRRQLELEEAPVEEDRGAEAAAKLAAQKAAITAEISDVKNFLDEIIERRNEVKAKIAALEAERAKLAANVNPQHLRIYDHQRVSRHPTIVALVNNTCSGCHLAQPPAVRYTIWRDTELVLCEMCGRILYTTETPKPREK